MRKQLLFLGAITLALGSVSMVGCGGRQSKEDQYVDGKLAISIRNLYFSGYAGGDNYLKEIEDKFEVSFTLTDYQWDQWETQINGAISADNLTDVFHANIDSYNFSNYYKDWAMDEMIKPLPSDLSRWPEIKKMIDNTTNIDSLKINGKLYGIPIAKRTDDPSTTYSPFTYIYRRDWAKEWGVYQENDEYTWEEFETLLETFRANLASTNRYALCDVPWGFPSIPNFYKQVPHCFAQDETGKYVNNYTTDAYIEGLEMAKKFKDNDWYYPDQNDVGETKSRELYTSNKVGVYYENLSYENFVKIKTMLRDNNASVAGFDLDEATAIMKIRGSEDNQYSANQYVLEGTDNWFSMTFFDFKISDQKMYKVLDILDWLLSEEGTLFAVYGFEDYDFVINEQTGKAEIVEDYWPKDKYTGEYLPKTNGARYLRYLASLGYDLLEDDPLTDKKALEYLNNWDKEMKTAYEKGELKVLKESKEVMWLTTEKKAFNSGNMRKNALNNVMKYIYGTIATIDEFKGTFGNIWNSVLEEINTALGKK